MTSCDLKSCYDRVAHTPAVLAMLGYGIPAEPMYSMFHAIQNMKFITRTAFGDSEETFGGKEKGFLAKPQGLGQGNGCGPPVWAVVSSRMFEVLHKRGLVTSFKTPMTKKILELSGFAFVDDSDILADADSKNNPVETMINMQKAIDCWEGVAKSTGGALAPSKSWWYLIHYKWDNKGQWSYGDTSNLTNRNLKPCDKYNKLIDLEYLPATQGKKMLGVHLAPDGNNKLQFKKMKDKARELAGFARAGHIKQHEAWIALQTMAMKSLEYPLPALTMTEDECEKVMWILIQSFLPKLGINRYMKRDVIYGSKSKQGLGIKNLFITQGLAHVNDLIEHMWKDTITGHLIVTELHNLRLEVGSNIPILESNYEDFSDLILTESWLQHTWKFMSQHEMILDIETPKITLARENDEIIMDMFMEAGIKGGRLHRANRCRMYL